LLAIMKKIFWSRHSLIAGSVVLFHLGALWALQTGLLQRAVAVIVPVQLLSEFIAPPRPNVAPPSPPPPPPVRKPVTPPVRHPTAAQPPPPMPLAMADPTPAPQAPVGVVQPPVTLAPMLAPVAATPGPPAPPPPQVELPSSDADYLHNAKPAYPLHSRRLGEQGKVVVRVLIGADGVARKAEIRTSSGFERLDQSALATVQRWRYVPGKRAGVVEAMWFSIPVNFVLE
jgi:protein TonB